MSYIKLGDTLVIPFSTCNSAGALTNADALPVVVVRDNGVDLAYVPTVTQISAGRYEVAIVASGGNGFTVGHHCSVWVYTNMATVSIGDGIGWFNVKGIDDDDINTRLTSARAGYLDNLNIGGNVAASSEVTSIQNNTRCVRVVPDVLVVPTSSTRTYRIELLLYDEVGNMEAPDSAPTIALVNQIGTDRSARLDSTTMTLVSAGRYRSIYTSTAGDTTEELVWAFSVVEGGATRIYGNVSAVQPLSPTVVDANVVSMATDSISAAALSAAAATKVFEGWSAEGSATPGDLIRGIMAAVLNKVTDFRTGTYAFKSMDGSKTRATVTADASGRIAVVFNDLTP